MKEEYRLSSLKSRAHIKKAKDLLKNGEQEKCLKEIDFALNELADLDQTYYILAMCLKEMQDYESALNYIHYSLLLNNKYIASWILKAEICKEMKLYELALKTLKEMPTENSTLPFSYYYLMGYLDIKLENYKKAIQNLSFALRDSNKSTDEELHCLLMRTYAKYKIGSILGAHDDLDLALKKISLANQKNLILSHFKSNQYIGTLYYKVGKYYAELNIKDIALENFTNVQKVHMICSN
jgi:tetratricopeptide (TPR) repeat protein